ncbi:uncharacterized protein LOC129581276 isoform X2 [Paramacrobiotus metropolitanus]|uniref:uncharacterized protein LOC129581276 isoform X2 n=1 Tax=Paramacrobiotus metropolitanus TaxID=2943436 RepID=UPI002445F65A|nr:uncharacterized protein LOC129581276 isoform X2 [Paramacrobiotus metropolitanus]
MSAMDKYFLLNFLLKFAVSLILIMATPAKCPDGQRIGEQVFSPASSNKQAESSHSGSGRVGGDVVVEDRIAQREEDLGQPVQLRDPVTESATQGDSLLDKVKQKVDGVVETLTGSTVDELVQGQRGHSKKD